MSEGRFAGVDWASEEHAVCVVDERGRILEGRRYRHSEPGIRALCARLVRLRVALVALERPDGLLIERLLDAGLAVVAVHPNQLRDQLATFWPGASKVFWSVDSQIALTFLRRYPTPLDARGLGEQRLEAFLKRHG
jgi:Transposase